MINIIIEEMKTSVNLGYLSSIQLHIVKKRLYLETTYTQLVSIFKLSGRTPLSHCIKRTCLLEPWSPGIVSGYLSKHDLDFFFTLLDRLWMNQNAYIQREPALKPWFHPCWHLKKRFILLFIIGILSLILEALKLPHLTGYVAFSASGHAFKPLIILPKKRHSIH